jgi:lipopolysaccharide export LptBFGC system permease protein LptF
MILDMGNVKDTPLILGCPFLNTANACIYVASGQIQFYFVGRKEIFVFASGQPLFDEKQEKKKHLKRIKINKPKLIEELEKPTKKKNNRKRWRKKKDLSSNSSSPLNLTRPSRWNKRKYLRPRTSDLEPDKKVSFPFLAFIYRISLVASHLDFQ